MKTIFITRDLSDTSIFRTQLEAAGFTVHGQSLLQFSAVAFDSVPHSDWLFFYSKNGVKYFFEGLKRLNKPIPKNTRWAAIGKGTAELLQSQTKRIDFIGTADTLATANDFLKLAKTQTVLFPQAEHSRQTIQDLLGNKIVAENLSVYKNEPKQRITIPDCDALVFTSPMNAEAYFKNRILLNNQKVFAIGRTTERTLASLGIVDYTVAEEPSEEALVKVILEF
ncbi:MAG: uroporphyrinogen-III synthase [Saprospiraceae bacterium]|jgi:uroporphyrinogen-III synthase